MPSAFRNRAAEDSGRFPSRLPLGGRSADLLLILAGAPETAAVHKSVDWKEDGLTRLPESVRLSFGQAR
jgi:hypothetical protein